jgi:hypothetical protein
VKTPVTIAPEALDFTRLIRSGETVGWAEATAEPVFLTRLLDAQAERCPPFRLFFALTFSDAFGADHPNWILPNWPRRSLERGGTVQSSGRCAVSGMRAMTMKLITAAAIT